MRLVMNNSMGPIGMRSLFTPAPWPSVDLKELS